MAHQESAPAPQTHQEVLFEMSPSPVAPKIRPDILSHAGQGPSEIDGVQLEMTETFPAIDSEAKGTDLSDETRRAQMRAEREDSGWGDRKNDPKDYGSRRTGPAVVSSIVKVEITSDSTSEATHDETTVVPVEERLGQPQKFRDQLAELKARRAERGDADRLSPNLPLGTEADRVAAEIAKDKQALSHAKKRHPANYRTRKK